jgi:hypothetical protein
MNATARPVRAEVRKLFTTRAVPVTMAIAAAAPPRRDGTHQVSGSSPGRLPPLRRDRLGRSGPQAGRYLPG